MALMFMGIRKLNEKMKGNKEEKNNKKQSGAALQEGSIDNQYRREQGVPNTNGQSQQAPENQPQAQHNGGYKNGDAGEMN